MVEEIILSNGMRVWLAPSNAEERVYGCVVVRIGAKDSPNTGIAHYFEHIMFKGTSSIGTTDYQKEAPLLEQIANKYQQLKEAGTDAEAVARIQREINQLNKEAAKYATPNDFNNLIARYGGANLNAGTSYDYTIYHNSFSPQYLTQWCQLNSERLVDPVFRLFQSELETVYEEKNMIENRLGNGAQQALLQKLFAPHPYQYPIIGGAEHLKRPDLHAMARFYHQYYHAGNMALILTGAVQREGIEPLLERTFGRVPAGEPARPSTPSPQPFRVGEQLTVKVPMPFVRMAGLFWQTPHGRHPHHLQLQVIEQLLSNEGKTGWLDQLTLQHKVTSAGTFNLSLNDAGAFGLFVLPKLPFQTNKSALKLLLSTVNRVREGRFTTEELERVKLSMLRSLQLVAEEPEKLSQVLANLFSLGSNWQEREAELQRLKTITKEELVLTAQTYLGDNYLTVLKKRGDYPKQHLPKPPYEPLTLYGNTAESAFSDLLRSLPTQPYTPKYIHLSTDVERKVLGDGCQLLKVHNDRNNIFTLQLLYHHSGYHHPQQSYLADYLDLVGGGGLNSQEHLRQLQQLGATLAFASTENNFRITLTGYDHLIQPSLQLMWQFLSAPEVNQKKIRLLADAKRIDDKALAKNPAQLANRLSQWVRYGNRATFRQELRLHEVKALRATNLVSVLQQVMAAELDIFYTGKHSLQDLVTWLLPHTQSVPQRTPWGGYLYLQPTRPQQPLQLFFLHQPNATQAEVRIFRPLGQLTAQERWQSIVYDIYLGGGMGSVLFQEVRELMSLAYSVGSQLLRPIYNQPTEETSQLIYMGTQPDALPTAVDLLLQLIQQEHGSGQRLARTIENIQAQAASLIPSLRKRAAYISAMERQGYTQDYAKLLAEESRKVTIEQLVQFQRTHVLGQPIAIMVVGDRHRIPLQALSHMAPLQEVPRKFILP